MHDLPSDAAKPGLHICQCLWYGYPTTMFSDVPPGISFLIKRLPQLILPPVVVFTTLSTYRSYVDHNVPSGWFLYMLSYPLALSVGIAYTAILKRVVAARMGAALLPEPPFMEDPTPGGLLFLYGIMKESKDGYIGMVGSTL